MFSCNNTVGAGVGTGLVELSAFPSSRKAIAVKLIVYSWKECIPYEPSFL